MFGDRWTLLVLRDIVVAGRRYLRELQAGSEEGIASNILADRLKRLVESGLLPWPAAWASGRPVRSALSTRSSRR